MYQYTAYWRTWSRVLLDDFNGQFIELNLTHVNGDWGGVKNETIRVHSTPRAKDDKVQRELPLAIKQAMIASLGSALCLRLLTFDYLPNIDWTRYKQANNGGASYNVITRELNREYA